MSRRRERSTEFEKEYQQLQKHAKSRVASSVWDRDPIKQYIRRFAWLEIIRSFAARRHESGVDRPLRYLTIPGPNATDIGLLWREGLLLRDSKGFPDVAICDKTSADEVVAKIGEPLGYSSRWLHEAVRYPNGELCSCFPFDIVNIDLCGSVVTSVEGRDQALRRLVGIRWIIRQQRGQGFLLLLTTSCADRAAKGYFLDILQQNLENDRFQRAYLKRYRSLDLGAFEDDYSVFLSIVLPKAIGKMARDRGYRIKEHFVAKYDRECSHMLCHSFEFEPLGVRVASKRYEPCFKCVLWDELNDEMSDRTKNIAQDAYREFAVALLERDIQDVVKILGADAELMAKMTSDAESLIGWYNESGRS